MKNDLGVDPDDWFESTWKYMDKIDPLTPITDEYAPSSYEPPYENPSDAMPIARDYSMENPDESDNIEEEKGLTVHEKMYRFATKNGGSWLGGSENIQFNGGLSGST